MRSLHFFILLLRSSIAWLGLKQKSRKLFQTCGFMVGAAGFEPATSCSQSRRDNRATLRPEGIASIILICSQSKHDKRAEPVLTSYSWRKATPRGGESGIRTRGTVARTAV